MKIYIVGSGGVGGYFGGLLAKAGKDVAFLARGEHYRALKERGLVIKSAVGDFEVGPAQVVETISDIREPDLVLFAVKTYDTAEAAKQLAKVVSDKTVVITFQNGVDNDVQIRKYVKKGYVYPGVAYVISAKTRPGVIEQTSGGRKLIFGDRKSANNPKLKEIEKMMRDAGVDATASEDIARDLWKKFMFIVAFSGMTALYREPIGAVLSDPTSRSEYENCLKEAIAVAKSLGVNVSDDAFEDIMALSQRFAQDSKSSLLVDIEKGRQNEIETLNGAVVRFAREKGIEVPVNERIYRAIE